MSKQKDSKLQIDFNYIPAVLHKSKDGYRIEYYVTNPITLKMTRQRMRVDKIFKAYAKKRDALIHINGIIESINAKLRCGYNPYFQADDSRLYEKLSTVAEKFLAEKKKELRPDTVRSYSSFVTMFLCYFNRLNQNQTASMVNKTLAIQYMDYIYTERNVSNRTYNNHIKMARVFWNWCVEKCYAKENPFSQLKLKRKEEKKRILIPAESRKQMRNYLTNNNKGLLLVSWLIYYSLIRPTEIRRIKVGDVSLANHCIAIRGDNAKNHHTRYATITDEIEHFLVENDYLTVPQNLYLIGNSYRPSETMASHTHFGRDWIRMREAIGLPAQMQLYSLRDTGITEMLKSGIPDLTVMQHADHSDLGITSIYAKHADPKLIETIRSMAPTF